MWCRKFLYNNFIRHILAGEASSLHIYLKLFFIVGLIGFYSVYMWLCWRTPLICVKVSKSVVLFLYLLVPHISKFNFTFQFQLTCLLVFCSQCEACCSKKLYSQERRLHYFPHVLIIKKALKCSVWNVGMVRLTWPHSRVHSPTTNMLTLSCVGALLIPRTPYESTISLPVTFEQPATLSIRSNGVKWLYSVWKQSIVYLHLI